MSRFEKTNQPGGQGGLAKGDAAVVKFHVLLLDLDGDMAKNQGFVRALSCRVLTFFKRLQLATQSP